ncbi:hypothetical protein D4764_15G0013030 [Takifugu flavidus]|uniref:Uncharacterized protein n=1 Tax=Takifugu flavidus TaxID=433684 RepID=A0A5C6P6Y9_9TELE|nr:hypothetical protein D4764_15G0013030 [Takifugu flavidus]
MGGLVSAWRAQRQSLNNHVSSAGLHYPPVQQAECQPGLLAGCGKVNGGGKTSYCVTLERNGEGRPSVSSGLPYPRSKWTRAARGEATDTHRAKPTSLYGDKILVVWTPHLRSDLFECFHLHHLSHIIPLCEDLYDALWPKWKNPVECSNAL